MGKNKRFSGLLLAAVMLLALLPLPSRAATGTAITTKAQLNNIRNKLSGSYYLAADIEFTEADFAQGGAYYNNGAGWTPIGTKDAPFTGTFDGNGYKIKGLQINASGTGDMYIGLFGASSGTLQNVALESGSLTVSCTGSKMYVGSIVGYNTGTVTDCVSNAPISCTFGTYGSYLGGVVGYLYSGSVTGCKNYGSITGTDTGSSYSSEYMGGICGGSNSGTVITGCTNYGSLTANFNPYTAINLGGIVSINYSQLTECENQGDITLNVVETGSGSNYSWYYLGGITGGNYGSISDCTNSGDISATGRCETILGGIAGSNSKPYNQTAGSLSGCANSGNITVDVIATADQWSTYSIGGIAGRNYITLDTSYNTGTIDVTAVGQVTTNLTVEMEINLGGVAGENDNLYDMASVSRCYNAGSITLDANAGVPRGFCTGGVIGYNSDSAVDNCFNTGNLTVTSQSIAVPNTYTGGVVGANEKDESTATTTNCYNVGTLQQTCRDSGPNYCGIGGVAGYNNDTLSGCYYVNSETLGAGGLSEQTGTTACPASDMTKQATFTSFDFTDTWTMGGNTSYLYPELIDVPMQNVRTITSISIHTKPKDEFFLTDPLDVTGGKLRVNYSDNTYDVIDITEEMVFDFDSNSAGTCTCTVAYAGLTTTYDVTIIPIYVTSITISTLPSKTVYYMGESPSLAGGKMTVYYNNGKSEIKDLTLASFYNWNFQTPGQKTITVKYSGCYASYNVMLYAVEVIDVTMYTTPSKTYYHYGDSLNTSGGMIYVLYNNGTSKYLAITNSMVSGFNPTQLGSQILYVTYEGIRTSYSINVYCNHSWMAADCHTPRTCYICRTTDGDPLDHKWNEATCLAPKTCRLCGDTEGEIGEHKYDQEVATEDYLASAATCLTPAEYFHSCICGLEGLTTFQPNEELADCVDEQPRDHKCDVCNTPMGPEHEPAEGSHNCSYCGLPISECIDEAPKNHLCDICGEAYGPAHEPAEGSHDCGYCGLPITECIDVDPKNHLCDICAEAYGPAHEPAEGSHDCGYCGLPITACIDEAPKNHLCDICGEDYGPAHEPAEGSHDCGYCGLPITECIDEAPKNHLCDICGEDYGPAHEPAEGSHNCGYCGEPITECEDKNPKDHECDVCGEAYGDPHKPAEGSHDCGYCGEPITECEDKNPKDHECDICGEAVGDPHKPAEGSHDCGYCGEPITECEDQNNDHLCDVCGKTVSDHTYDLKLVNSDTLAAPADCVTAPSYYFSCRCGRTGANTFTQGDSLGHDYADGVCRRCGDPDPDYKPPVIPEEPKVIRIAGDNRFDTAFRVAEQMKQILGISKFHTIVVASGKDFADALSGSYLAAVKNAPILLSYKQAQNDQVQRYIRENLAPGGRVYILGGTSAVPSSMEEGLSGLDVKRLAGDNRFATNLEVLKEAGIAPGAEILVCTGTDFADCLSAAATGKPILLTYKRMMPGQEEFLRTLSDVSYCIIGGENAVNMTVAKVIDNCGPTIRLSGSHRYQTSVLVAERFFDNPDKAVLAYARNFPDGLCGGALAAALKAPLILTDYKYYSFAAEYTNRIGIHSGYVLGGDTLVTEKAVNAIFG